MMKYEQFLLMLQSEMLVNFQKTCQFWWTTIKNQANLHPDLEWESSTPSCLFKYDHLSGPHQNLH